MSFNSLSDADKSGLWFDNQSSTLAIVDIKESGKYAYEAKVMEDGKGWKTGRRLPRHEQRGQWNPIDLPVPTTIDTPEPPKPRSMSPKFVPNTEGSFTMYGEKVLTVHNGNLTIPGSLCGNDVVNTTDEELATFIGFIHEARDLVRKTSTTAFKERYFYEKLVDEDVEEEEEEEEHEEDEEDV